MLAFLTKCSYKKLFQDNWYFTSFGERKEWRTVTGSYIALYTNHRQLLRYEKKRIRISIWHQKETYFKKQLGFENVSSGAEVHSKIYDQLIEA
jgi:hypothetical protein